MIAVRYSRVGLLVIVMLILGCEGKEDQDSKIKQAVEQAVTRDLKIYESAKKSLKKIEKEAQEKREKALNQ